MKFEIPQAEIVVFTEEDIITDSLGNEDDESLNEL